jgi:NTP pyrophosphatase (non-canonical NTP hydrolase)
MTPPQAKAAMTQDEYRAFIVSKASPATMASSKTQLSTAMLGLIGETGELTDHIKKWLYHGYAFDNEYVILELGDICWYAALYEHATGDRPTELALPDRREEAWDDLCIELARLVSKLAVVDQTTLASLYSVLEEMGRRCGATPEQVIETNVTKLNTRYAAGFTTKESVNRVEGPPEARQPTRSLEPEPPAVCHHVFPTGMSSEGFAKPNQCIVCGYVK